MTREHLFLHCFFSEIKIFLIYEYLHSMLRVML